MEYFDYKKIAREGNISPDELDQLCHRLRQEFPRDEMMYELHVLRACAAIKSGVLTIRQALTPRATKG